MARKKQTKRGARINNQPKFGPGREKNATLFKSLLEWVIPQDELFNEDWFHGNTKWKPGQLACQALIWSWQETNNVTDAFEQTAEICHELKFLEVAQSYTSFMNAIERYVETFRLRLRQQFQTLAEEVAGRFWRQNGWVLIAFDGSRVTTARTLSNERAFCAPNVGKGKTAKYRKKKTKGMRRRNNKEKETSTGDTPSYDTKDRSLANTMRALRKCMRNLHKYATPDDGLWFHLSRALVQKYNNGTDKKSRYRPKNPDKKPLGEPEIRKLKPEEREKLKQFTQKNAA